MSYRRVWFWLLVLLTVRCSGPPPPLVSVAVYTVPPLLIDVYPVFAMRPAFFRVRVTMVRDLDNRLLCYGYDGPEAKRSCRSLNGNDEPQTTTAYWDLRVPGDYHAQADLMRMSFGKERHFYSVQDFSVLGGF